MKLADLLTATPAVRVTGRTDRKVTGLCYDSRRLRAEEIFFAWRGEKLDGHAFIADAVGRGASAVVLESAEFIANDGPAYVEVTDARRALARMACAFHGNPARALGVIGITGTNGKTTTAFLLKHLFAAQGESVGLIGTVQYEIGARVIAAAARTTPEGNDLQALLAQMRDAGCTRAVMEVSSHALAQGRTDGLEFAAAVFTNFTPDHLDYHGSMEEYLAAKKILFTALGKSNVAVINLDDAVHVEIAEAVPAGVRTIGYGIENSDAEVCARDVCLQADGTRFVLELGGQSLAIRLPLVGRYNVSNALAAAASAWSSGLTAEQVAQGLETAPQVPGRMQTLRSGDGVTVVVDYAHTEDALEKALTALRALEPRQLVVLIGCGGDRDKTKRPAMARAAVEFADEAIFTADNPRSEAAEVILDQMEAGVRSTKNFRRIADRREAIAQAVAAAQSGDVICIAGKGHEATQEIAGVFHPFDDVQIAQEFLQRRAST